MSNDKVSIRTIPNIVCPYCSKQFHDFKSGFVNHLNNQHGWNIRETTLYFDSFKAFDIWKTHEEIATSNQFCQSHQYNSKICSIKIYQCIRSTGMFHSNRDHNQEHEEKEEIKEEEEEELVEYSRSIKGTCSARMTASIFPDGRTEVRYIREHVGHDQEYSHLRMNLWDRNFIRQHLLAGKGSLIVLQLCKKSSNRIPLVSLPFIHGILKELKTEQHIVNQRHHDGIKLRLKVESFEISENCYRIKLHNDNNPNNTANNIQEIVVNRSMLHSHQCTDSECLHRMKCSQCHNLCYHSVQCSCDEYRVEQKICIHIHYSIWQETFSQQCGDHTYDIGANYRPFFLEQTNDDNLGGIKLENLDSDEQSSEQEDRDSSTSTTTTTTDSSVIESDCSCSSLSKIFPKTKCLMKRCNHPNNNNNNNLLKCLKPQKKSSEFLEKYGEILEKITMIYDCYSGKNGQKSTDITDNNNKDIAEIDETEWRMLKTKIDENLLNMIRVLPPKMVPKPLFNQCHKQTINTNNKKPITFKSKNNTKYNKSKS